MSDSARKADLLPCPFCGEPGMLRSMATIPPVYCGGCSECGVEMGLWQEHEADAIAAWNTRAHFPKGFERIPDETLDRARNWLKEWDSLPLSDPRSHEAKRFLELNGIHLARIACAALSTPSPSPSEGLTEEERQLLVGALNSAEQLMLNGDEYSRGRARDLVIGVRRKLDRLVKEGE